MLKFRECIGIYFNHSFMVQLLYRIRVVYPNMTTIVWIDHSARSSPTVVVARDLVRRLARRSLDMAVPTTLAASSVALRAAVARRSTPTPTPTRSVDVARAPTVVFTARASSVRARSSTEDDADAATPSSSSSSSSSADEFAFEPRSKSKRKRDRSTTRRAKVDVRSPAVDSYLGKTEKTLSQESEEAYVKFLFYYICVIFVMGIVLGLDSFGKFPEGVDAFVSEKLYPFFTPFTGGFLAFSSVYGLIKTRDDPTAGK